MKKAADFIMKNWRPLVLVYVIVAAVVFAGILLFFWFGWKETEREKELWPDFEYDYPEESGWRKACIMCLSFFIALGCAILWPAVPLMIGGLLFLSWIAERSPELFGHMLETEPDDPENPEGD